MKTFVIIFMMICISDAFVNSLSAHNASFTNVQRDMERVFLERRIDHDGEIGVPDDRAPVFVPRVYMNGHLLLFETSCQGLTLQLVQDEEDVCYETVITGETLEIPSNYEGVYELRILQGNFIFYAEIEL